MKAGENGILFVESDIDIGTVESAIITLKGLGNVTKRYPDHVSFQEGHFIVPVTQEDNLTLSNGRTKTVQIEAQFNLRSKAVVKSQISSFTISNTLATEVLEGNIPSEIDINDITFNVAGGIVVAGIEGDKVANVVEDYFEAHKDEFRGADGRDGRDGIDGRDGRNGLDGRNGIDGKDYVITEADYEDIAEKTADKVDLTEVKKDINVINAELSERIRQPYIENGNEAITDCDNGSVRNFKAYGKSSQAQYKGYNLVYEIVDGEQWNLNTGDVQITSGRIRINPIKTSGSITVSATTSEDADYYSMALRLMKDGVLVGTSGYLTFKTGKRESITFNNPQEIEYDEIRPFIFGNVSVTTDKIFDIQIELGEVAHDYEPYVGGEISPSPNVPQDIENITELNFEVTSGQNMARDYFTREDKGQYQTVLFADWDIRPNTTYTLSFNSTPNCKFYMDGITVHTKYSVDASGKVVVTFTTKDISVEEMKQISNVWSEARQMWQIAKNDIVQSSTPLFSDVQIEVGTVAHAYKPYDVVTETRTIIPPIPLRNINVFADYLDVESGVWHKVTDETQISLPRGKYTGTPTGYRYATSVQSGILSTKTAEIMCRQLPYNIEAGIATSKEIVGIRYSPQYLTMVAQTTNEYVLEHDRINVDIVYARYEEELIPIDADDLEWLRNLQTTYPRCEISVTDQNGNEVDVKFFYKLKLESYIDRIAKEISDGRDVVDSIEARVDENEMTSAMAYVDSQLALALLDL